MKDARGKKVRAMMMTLVTQNEGLGDIHSVAELSKGSPLQKEIDWLIKNMVDQRKEQIKDSNKKKIDKHKKK